MTQEPYEKYMKRRLLEEEIEEQRSRLKPQATGHIHTTIGVLEERYKELTGKEYKSPRIYESPDKGKTIYRREFGNYSKREKIENNMEMMSLYDYLGHAAGSELGQQVANAAKKAGVKGEIREVRNPVYSGPVMLWPKAFLDLYFRGGLNEGATGKQLLKG